MLVLKARFEISNVTLILPAGSSEPDLDSDSSFLKVMFIKNTLRRLELSYVASRRPLSKTLGEDYALAEVLTRMRCKCSMCDKVVKGKDWGV
jgi:hypothetical protein